MPKSINNMPPINDEKFSVNAKLEIADQVLEVLFMWRLSKADAQEVIKFMEAKLEKAPWHHLGKFKA